MKSVSPRGLLVLLNAVVVLTGECAPEATSTLPDASTVMQRVVERSEADDRTAPTAEYSFEKRSIFEELDSSGKTTKTNEEVYAVFPIHGVSYSRLIRIQNRDLTEKELKEQNQNEQEFRKKLERHEFDESVKTNESWL